VLGGNLKGLVPGPCALSLPSVSGDGAPDLSGGSRSRELWFRCHGEPLVILVVEGGTSAAA